MVSYPGGGCVFVMQREHQSEFKVARERNERVFKAIEDSVEMGRPAWKTPRMYTDEEKAKLKAAKAERLAKRGSWVSSLTGSGASKPAESSSPVASSKAPSSATDSKS